MKSYILKELISEDRAKKRVAELAVELDQLYLDKDPLLVGILNGGFILCADLVRKMSLGPEVDFIRVASYGNDTNGAELKILLDLNLDIKDRHVLLVEDIVDSGRTLAMLMDRLLARKPASLNICAMVNKKSRRECLVSVGIAGFEINNNDFLVGCGMDYAGKHRGLGAIYELIFNEDSRMP